MDVVCDRCRAEYEFDDALVSERGTTVKCTSCGHQFKIYRMSSHPEGVRSWNLRRPDGTVIPFDSLAVLQKWILEGRVSKMDEICRGNEPWKPLGAIAELESFFSTAEIRASTVPSLPGTRPASHRVPAASGRPAAREGTPPTPSNAARSTPAAQGGSTLRPGGMPPVNTAHGYPAPPPAPSAARTGPTHHDRTAPIGTPVLPPKIGDDDATTVSAMSTASGYASGGSGAAIGAPPPPPKTVSLDPPALPAPRAVEQVSDDDVDEFPTPKPSGGKGLGWALAVGLVLAGGIGLAAWKLGYLSTSPRVDPATAARTVAPPQLDVARRLERRYTRQAFEEAREELARALAVAPDNAAVHAARAHVMALWSEQLKQRADDLDARTRAPGADGASLRAEAAVLRRDATERLDRARADADRAEAGAAALHGPPRASVEADLADVARIGGDVVTARRRLDAAHAEGPSTPDIELANALLARDTGVSTQAVEGLRATIARADDHVRARLALARLLAAQGDAASARRELEAVLRAIPGHDDAQWLTQALTRGEAPMIASATGTGERDAAAATTDAAVVASNTNPTSAPTANGAAPAAGRSYDQLVDDGDRYQDEGRSAQARERYRMALQMRPSGAEALAGMGFVDLEDRELSSAISNFRRALSASPSYGEALIGLGEAYTSQGSYEQALGAYNRYLVSNPSGPQAHMARRQVESLQERLHQQDHGSGADSGASGN
jgi:predicted Zn finger-like uncharacterized protein